MRQALLAFFDDRARELPWRTDSHPYRVWVSEIMLQQTRVDAVIPYYERWLARFPTVESLAEAPIDDVLHCWQGLGYYTRARNLHAAARIVRERHAGQLPTSRDALLALPGVGEYTAGAIASIAYGEATPAVDGNVRRVLARLLDEADPAPARLRDVAGRLVPADRPGDFNQSLMELGALVCVPRTPRCGVCPVQRVCAAFARGTQHERPAPRRAAPVPHFDVGTAVVIDAAGRLLLTRRPESGLLAGMWQFPGEIVAESGAGGAGGSDGEGGDCRDAGARAGGAARSAAVTAAEPALSGLLNGSPCEYLGTVDHVFSHRRESYHVFEFRCGVPTAAGEIYSASPALNSGTAPMSIAARELNPAHQAARWFRLDQLGEIALPAAQRRIAGLLKVPASRFPF